MHYFSPAEVMQLLEVIPHAKTADAVTAAGRSIAIAAFTSMLSSLPSRTDGKVPTVDAASNDG